MGEYRCYNASELVNPLTKRPHREWCVRVAREFRKKGRPGDPLARVAGNGSFGFNIRRVPDDPGIVQVEASSDGEVYLRHSRSTAAKPRKPGYRLASRSECMGSDPLADLLAVQARDKGKPRWRAKKGQKQDHCRRGIKP